MFTTFSKWNALYDKKERPKSRNFSNFYLLVMTKLYLRLKITHPI